ncbi:protein of unknown function [Azospirillum baldaniorum]|uniref:Uncharacterized protein n=1 Tax=Azospirillum baldaniorum TaxID=1064539 RepID=A0A9P1JPF1_9PROT|nr:protein of unknown function [Azospirillum baldaniorum]
MASSSVLVSYYASWLVLEKAMRASLYEAAFAALARLGGPLARVPSHPVRPLRAPVGWPRPSRTAGWTLTPFTRWTTRRPSPP